MPRDLIHDKGFADQREPTDDKRYAHDSSQKGCDFAQDMTRPVPQEPCHSSDLFFSVFSGHAGFARCTRVPKVGGAVACIAPRECSVLRAIVQVLGPGAKSVFFPNTGDS
jgi:hypothetical protein